MRLRGGGEIALGGEAERFVPVVPAILSIDRKLSLTSSSLVGVGSSTAASRLMSGGKTRRRGHMVYITQIGSPNRQPCIKILKVS